jgi:transcriptional regulator with XRE-family HTH domain
VTRSNFDPAAARLRHHLREMRRRAGLTQAALGERLQHTQQWVYKYEAGERRLDVIEFIEIARAIGFDPGEFINTLMDRPADLNAAPPCDAPRPRSSAKTRT